MPEAAIDEDGDSWADEDKIGGSPYTTNWTNIDTVAKAETMDS